MHEPAGSMYSVSDSGWMESTNFQQWFEKIFIPATRGLSKDPPVELFFDGHHSHISLSLIELARTNNVHLICFPPHCTHILQPLDVSVFYPFENFMEEGFERAPNFLMRSHSYKRRFSCPLSPTVGDFVPAKPLDQWIH